MNKRISIYIPKSFLIKQIWKKIVLDYLDYDKESDVLKLNDDIIDVNQDNFISLINENKSKKILVDILFDGEIFIILLYATIENKFTHPVYTNYQFIYECEFTSNSLDEYYFNKFNSLFNN